MQYVTYENLFGFFSIIIGIVGLFIAIYKQKNNRPTFPSVAVI